MKAVLKIWLHNGLGITLDVTSNVHHCISSMGANRNMHTIDAGTVCYKPTRRQTIPFIERLCNISSINDSFNEAQRLLQQLDNSVNVRRKFLPTGPIDLIIYTDDSVTGIEEIKCLEVLANLSK